MCSKAEGPKLGAVGEWRVKKGGSGRAWAQSLLLVVTKLVPLGLVLTVFSFPSGGSSKSLSL